MYCFIFLICKRKNEDGFLNAFFILGVEAIYIEDESSRRFPPRLAKVYQTARFHIRE